MLESASRLTAYDAALGATIDDVEKTLMSTNAYPGGDWTIQTVISRCA